MSYTLDTSVLAKAIIPPRRRKQDSIFIEQQRLFTIAKSFLAKIENSQEIMNIPSIALVEIAAVAARLTGKDERGIQATSFVKKHGNIIHDTSFLDEAVRIASQIHISGFDSIFIACAKITNSTLITDDKTMHDAAISLSISSILLREINVNNSAD